MVGSAWWLCQGLGHWKDGGAVQVGVGADLVVLVRAMGSGYDSGTPVVIFFYFLAFLPSFWSCRSLFTLLNGNS